MSNDITSFISMDINMWPFQKDIASNLKYRNEPWKKWHKKNNLADCVYPHSTINNS